MLLWKTWQCQESYADARCVFCSDNIINTETLTFLVENDCKTILIFLCQKIVILIREGIWDFYKILLEIIAKFWWKMYLSYYTRNQHLSWKWWCYCLRNVSELRCEVYILNHWKIACSTVCFYRVLSRFLLFVFLLFPVCYLHFFTALISFLAVLTDKDYKNGNF